MRLFLTLRIALRAISKNKMRAGLTVLGVVIGIAAVTTMISLGESASAMVNNEFQSFGSNIILVFPGSQGGDRGVRRAAGTSPTLTAEDCQAIVAECPSIADATPFVGVGSQQVIYGNVNWQPRELLGVGPGFVAVRNWRIRRGGFFTERDVASAAQVCVVGHTIVRKLFQTLDPIGETVRIGNTPFRVIGVLEEKGANMMGDDEDDILLIPHTAVSQRIFRTKFRNVHAVMASATSPKTMPQAEEEIRQLLLQRHRIAPGNPADFTVNNTKEFAAALNKVMGILTMLLASIAFISLIVGGVGIMNIMLVSVTERTREIGVRMAVGARPSDILRQFLVESIVLSVIGGLIGFSLGIAASSGVTMVLNRISTGANWPLTISFSAGMMAVVCSAIVGMASGFYPAFRASRLDPIDALRYE